MRIAVVFGGRSVEHDVSIVTAHQVMEALSGRHEVVPVYVARDGRWWCSPRLNDLDVYRQGRFERIADEVTLAPVPGAALQVRAGRLRGERRIEIDVVVPCIHGTYGEDGTLQGLLELADLPYTGSGVVASAVGMDKVAMRAAFTAAGLPVVDALVAEPADLADPEALAARAEDVLGYPVFVKPARLGSSVGIGKARDRAGLLERIEVARRYDTRLLIERAMEGCIEVNCSVLGGPDRPPRVSVCEQPVAWEEFLSFEDKYLRGGKGRAKAGMASQERRIPAPISPELTKQVQENALAAFKAIGASGVARVDSFVDQAANETWVMEINTVPGSLSFYLWAESGLGFPELMDELIDIARATHAAKRELMFTFDSGMLERATTGAKTGD